ncbi:peptidylprolyl isomerase [Defluviitalea phaphyphila]|uniref:peptidylprolyl isomerase n=1 Tax=Defluviitalea phaphyphila TaxID=1473580 RepID=UPI0007301CAA|nr:peptidylprolyl isomerase [Defluviitalea phaphyphila]
MENKILATVDGREIKQSDVFALMQSLGQNAMQFNTPQGQKDLLNEIIAQELLYSDALENKFDQEEQFITVLEQMKKTLLIQYAANKLMSSVSVSDEEAKEYFDNNKNKFIKEKTVAASHILVNTKEEAEKILEEINNGLGFDEAARKYSSCPSSNSGGFLGEFPKGKMVPEFEQAAFSMKVGEISSPVKTQFGYHLIKVEKVNEARESSFEEVKENVKQQCLSQKQKELYIKKQEELKQKYTVNIME